MRNFLVFTLLASVSSVEAGVLRARAQGAPSLGRCSTNLKTLASRIVAFGREKKLPVFLEPLPDVGADMKIEWRIQKLVRKGENCLAVISRAFVMGDIAEPENGSLHVFAYQASKVLLLAEAMTLPSSLRIALGSASPGYDERGVQGNELPTDLYYVELTGPSVGEALASIYTQTPYCGLDADISKNRKKEDFDPTPGRKWRLENATYSLIRGSTPEIWDVRPGHLDDDYEGMYRGSAGHVAPWGPCYIRKVWAKSEWKDVLAWSRGQLQALDPLN